MNRGKNGKTRDFFKKIGDTNFSCKDELPDAKSQLIERDPDSGKDWEQEKGVTGWDGWMASPTQWIFCTNSVREWRTGKPGVLLSMGLQRVDCNFNWTTVAHISQTNSDLIINRPQNRGWYNIPHTPSQVYTEKRSAQLDFLVWLKEINKTEEFLCSPKL